MVNSRKLDNWFLGSAFIIGLFMFSWGVQVGLRNKSRRENGRWYIPDNVGFVVLQPNGRGQTVYAHDKLSVVTNQDGTITLTFKPYQ